MLNLSDIDIIENEVINKFADEGLDSDTPDQIVEDDYPDWNDADRYYLVPARCVIPGEIINDWIYSNFWDLMNRYLKSQGVKNLYELAQPEDLIDSDAYYDFCLDQCNNAESYFWDYDYDSLCRDYFLEHAEII